MKAHPVDDIKQLKIEVLNFIIHEIMIILILSHARVIFCINHNLKRLKLIVFMNGLKFQPFENYWCF